MDKSRDRVHLMFLEFLQNLHDLPQYSWGSGCLPWLYRELCRASEKGASQIGGACTLVQYWAWAKLPFLCSRIEPHLDAIMAHGHMLHLHLSKSFPNI